MEAKKTPIKAGVLVTSYITQLNGIAFIAEVLRNIVNGYVQKVDPTTLYKT